METTSMRHVLSTVALLASAVPMAMIESALGYSPAALQAEAPPQARQPATSAASEAGFVSLFDGKTLEGWKLANGHGEGYGVKDGVLYCAKGGGGIS
jgi:3-keto-disaccharide hydrolase